MRREGFLEEPVKWRSEAGQPKWGGDSMKKEGVRILVKIRT